MKFLTAQILSPQEKNIADMKERLEYIDAIKGFAILLVVMGHVIAWCFNSLSEVQAIGKPMLLWNCIYAFHMPLFIFISGLLFGYSQFPTAKRAM